MSTSHKNRTILLTLALLLAISLISGSLIWPRIGDASSQENESPGLVSSISPPDSSFPIYYTNQVAVLTYHHLDSQESIATISPDRFREHIYGLKMLGYQFISLGQLNDFLKEQKPVPPNAVAITFDDGYASVYNLAFPIMQAEQVPAAVFMIVKHVGAEAGQIPKLTWEQMYAMQNAGIMFESHTYDSHIVVRDESGRGGPSLTSRGYVSDARRDETSGEYEDRILYDLSISRSILQDRLGTAVDYLALPFGSQNQTVQNTARQAGYKYVFTVEPGMVDSNTNRLALCRFNAGQAGNRSQDIHSLILKYLSQS